MKKIVKKLSAVLLAMLLVMSLGVLGASAAEPTTGSIEIFKFSPLGSGDPGDGETAPAPGSFRPIEGVKYKIYKVADWTGGKIDAGYTSLVNGITFTAATTPAEVHTALTTAGTAATREVTTGSAGSIKADGLNLGLYLVKETDATGAKYADGAKEDANITQLGAPFFVSIPMTNKAGTAWLYDIKVYPKNATSTAKKEADEVVAGVGDKVTYTLTVGVPENVKDLEKFIVTDTLPAQVNFDSVKVYTDSGKTTELATSAVTLTEPAKTGGGTVIATFNKNDTALEAVKGQEIYIVIETIVNKEAVIVDEINNTATVDYGSDTPNINISTKTHVGKVTIEKVDKDNTGTKLQGVQFKIYQMVNSVKTYIKDPNNTANDYIATTGPDGIATFAGLNDGTYFIEEILAHTDYQILKDPVEVVITNDDKAAAVTKVITNIKKFNLPITGGMGTMLFTGIGVALIGVGVVIFFTSSVRRRRRNQNKHS